MLDGGPWSSGPWSLPMRPRTLLLALLPAAALAQPAPACSIPVFRYALERWEPAPCEAFVFHRGPLDPESDRLVRSLQGPARPVNLSLTTTDLSGLPLGRLRPAEGGPPWLVVRTAQAGPNDPHAWQGPLTADNVRLLLDSPARRRLVERLAAGDAVVFVLLESGDEKEDRRAADLLGRELPRLEKEIELPGPKEDGPQLRTSLPLRVRFPVLRLSRRDPEEAGFVRLLLGSEDGLFGLKGPIVFPVFGRGRVLCALAGDDLSGEQLTRVARFLCGACSCQVKELNPGSDLLLAADWDALLPWVEEDGVRPAGPVPAPPAVRPPARPPAWNAPAAAAGVEESDARRFVKLAAAVTAGVVLITATLVLRGRALRPLTPEAAPPAGGAREIAGRLGAADAEGIRAPAPLTDRPARGGDAHG
jgi:hypothetical protein